MRPEKHDAGPRVGKSRAIVIVACVAMTFEVLSDSGCNRSSVKLYPVHGKVLFKDQPADGAQVVFQPLGDSGAAESKTTQPMAYGTVSSDGSFTLRAEPYGEGAAAGDYKVLITWYGVDPRDPEQRVSKLSAKYADPGNPVFKATVKAEPNELEPFKLQ